MADAVSKLQLVLGADASAFLSATQQARASAERLKAGTASSFAGVTSAAKSMSVGVVDALGKIGLAGLGLQTLAGAAKGAGEALGIGLNVELENTRAQLVAFTKSGEQADKILADIRKEASTTPFAFQEMAAATASLLPASKQSGVALMDLVKQAEILAASNPAQGLEGAAFALKEALGGDFVSIVERFNLPRQRLNQLKEEGVPAIKAVQIAMQEMGLDADLVSGLANTASGRWSTLMDTFDTLRATLSKPLFDVLSKALGDLQPILDRNMESLTAFADAAGKTIAALATGDMKTAWELLSSGALQAADAIQGGLQQAIQWVQDNGPMLRETLLTWGIELVNWIGPQIMPMLNKLQDLREAAFAWVIEQVPGWIDTLGQWAVQLIEWVGPMIAPALVELGKFLTRVLDWVLEVAPEILKKFIGEWVPAALGWVARAALELGKHLPDILDALGEWILVQGIPRVVTLFAKLGVALVQGIMEGAGKMWGALFEAVGTQLANAFQAAKDAIGAHSPSDLFMEIGESIMEGIIEGVELIGADLEQTLAGWLTRAWDRAGAINAARAAAEAGKLTHATTAQFNDILASESLNSQAMSRVAHGRMLAGLPRASATELSMAAAQTRHGAAARARGLRERMQQQANYEAQQASFAATSLRARLFGLGDVGSIFSEDVQYATEQQIADRRRRGGTGAFGLPMEAIDRLVALLDGGLTVEMDGHRVGRLVSRGLDQRADVRARMGGAGGVR